MEEMMIEYEVINVWPMDLNNPDPNESDGSESGSEMEYPQVYFKRPHNLDILLDMPPAPEELQRKYGWSETDKSRNIYLRNPFTMHRNPVAWSTDCIRGKTGVTKGLHVWEVKWAHRDRGTQAAVGVATQKAPLQMDGYHNMLGENDQSWGWNLVHNKFFYVGEDGPCNHTYPAFLYGNHTFLAPEKLIMALDMDLGTLSFEADGRFCGVAVDGLNGLELFPIISTVWGHCQVTLKYIGGLTREPSSLKHLCRRAIRKQMGTKSLEENAKQLELPRSLYSYLLYKDGV